MKLPERWFLPLAFAGGFVVGLVALWVYVMVVSTTAPSKTTPVAPQQEASSAPEVVASTSTTPDEAVATTTIEIAWDPIATRMTTSSALDVIASFTTDTSMEKATLGLEQTPPVFPDDNTEWLEEMWKLGTVSSGPLTGGEVYLIATGLSAPGGYGQTMFIVSHGKGYVLPAYSPSSSVFFTLNATPLTAVDIPSLDSEPTLKLQNGKELVREGNGFNVSFVDPKGAYLLPQNTDLLLKIGLTEDGRTLYAIPSKDGNAPTGGCVYRYLPDGQLVRYASPVPARSAGETRNGGIVPAISWDQAYTEAEGTSYNARTIGGCGAMGCSDIVSDADVGSLSSYDVAGKTPNGDPVYTPKDPATNDLVKNAYDQWYAPTQDGKKPSFSEFIRSHPAAILLWKDAFGRWVRMTTVDAMPMTECGKPVIYLYPPKTEPVSVLLAPFINVTKSEPTYPSQGWNVIAHPDGTLEYQGSSYGSLFWEGTGVAYDAPKDGFVIKDGDVDVSLKTILTQYGLNEKESQEFRDFWVPKMTGAPYYRVSFLTSAWSAAAPLRVIPPPDTVIRIFMDWQKLHAPIILPAPQISTPVRRGFTLVEWGGLLRK